MATNVWRGCARAVAQVWKATIGSTTVGHTFVVTVTETDGAETAAITYVAVTGDTATTIAANFAAVWNASGNKLVSRVTASADTGVLTLTADTAGRPFTVAESGTGTWTDPGVTTASSGPSDGGLAENWSDGVPTANDVVWFPPGTPSLLYGLDLSAVTAGTISVLPGYTGQIGRVEDGKLYYFKLAGTGLTLRGAGALYAFDVGSSAISPLVELTGTAKDANAVNQVQLIGSALASVHVGAGDVGVATFPADTATVTVGGSAYNAGKLQIGSGATVTGTAWTVYGAAAQILSDAVLPTVTVIQGVAIPRTAVFTTTNLKDGATLRLISSGTYATVNTYGTVTIDNSANGLAKTVSTLNINGPLYKLDPAATLTVTTTNNNYTANIDYAIR